jgi:hypothetical protein
VYPKRGRIRDALHNLANLIAPQGVLNLDRHILPETSISSQKPSGQKGTSRLFSSLYANHDSDHRVLASRIDIPENSSLAVASAMTSIADLELVLIRVGFGFVLSFLLLKLGMRKVNGFDVLSVLLLVVASATEPDRTNRSFVVIDRPR